MKLKEKWSEDRGLKLLFAFLLNLLFLLAVLAVYQPRFEANDDVLMSKFVDGQMAEKTAYIPFLDITLSWALKMLYVLGGDSVPWYSLAQYAALLLGFTALSWVLLRRYRLFPALCMMAVLLLSFGMNSYVFPTFSKVGAVFTVAGYAMMFYAMRNSTGKKLRLPLVLGTVMVLLGYAWRNEIFFAASAILCPMGLYYLIRTFSQSQGKTRAERLRALWLYARPFAVLVLILGLLIGFNSLMWSRDGYGSFTEFNNRRYVLMDHDKIPKYAEMPEVYDSLELDENAIYLLENWSFYDTEKFDLDTVNTLIEERDKIVQKPSPGECLGTFLDVAVPGLSKTLAFMGLALMLLMWVACGRHDLSQWLAVAMCAGVFGLVYLYMIYQNRYLANRVDMGLLMALAVALSMLMSDDKLNKDRVFCLVLAAMALFCGMRSNRASCRLSDQYAVEDKSVAKAAIERILADEEHLYLCKVWSIDHEMYTPLEVVPAGYADRIVLLGGWSVYHPSIEHVLDSYGIENPYPDMINNDDVLLIDKDVNRTVEYLRKYYDPNVYAQRLDELSDETGLEIYRVLS